MPYNTVSLWLLQVGVTVRVHIYSNRSYRGGGGRTRLPKFKFSAKFPIGLHVILQIQIRKFENDCYIMWKINLTENPSRFNVEPLFNVKWILFVNYTVIRTVFVCCTCNGRVSRCCHIESSFTGPPGSYRKMHCALSVTYRKSNLQ